MTFSCPQQAKSLITHLSVFPFFKIFWTYPLFSLLQLFLSLWDYDFYLFSLFTFILVRFLKAAWENVSEIDVPETVFWVKCSLPFSLQSSSFISISLMPWKVPIKFSTSCQFITIKILVDSSLKISLGGNIIYIYISCSRNNMFSLHREKQYRRIQRTKFLLNEGLKDKNLPL